MVETGVTRKNTERGGKQASGEGSSEGEREHEDGMTGIWVTSSRSAAKRKGSR